MEIIYMPKKPAPKPKQSCHILLDPRMLREIRVLAAMDGRSFPSMVRVLLERAMSAKAGA